MGCFAMFFVSMGMVNIRIIRFEDRNFSASHFAHRDIQQKDRGLKNVQTNDRLNQIFTSDDNIESGHHQKDHDPVVIESKELIQSHSTCSLPANA